MRDVLRSVSSWREQGDDVALAVVVDVVGSGPRPVGTVMAIAADGSIAGNVSAGCVDAAVVAQAQEALGDGTARRRRYGISDEQALSVGLTCGGQIEVLTFPLGGAAHVVLGSVQSAVADACPVALAVVVDGPAPHGALMAIAPHSAEGSLGSDGLDAAVAADARALLAAGETGVHRYGSHGEPAADEIGVLIMSLGPPPRMLVFGATDVGAAVARLGRFLGYRVTVCDARAAFATRERFPDVDEVVVEWPHRYLERVEVDERTVTCVLTHDSKFDVPLLAAAVRTRAGYIGLMGSRRTIEDRRRRLHELGIRDELLERLRAPVGLDLGARTPEEMAVSIAAEVIALRRGGTGRPLRETEGAIHRPARA